MSLIAINNYNCDKLFRLTLTFYSWDNSFCVTYVLDFFMFENKIKSKLYHHLSEHEATCKPLLNNTACYHDNIDKTQKEVFKTTSLGNINNA
jgi:hypothetical protein